MSAKSRPIRIQLFNAFIIYDNDQLVELPNYTGMRGLLALLATYPDKLHSRAWLCQQLFPHDASQRGRRKLSQTLWQINKCLPAALAVSRQTIGWDSSILLSTDLQQLAAAAADIHVREYATDAQYEQWQSAIHLYTGLMLVGFVGAWVAPIRERVSHLQAAFLQGLIGHAKRRDDLDAAAQFGRKLLELDPQSERYAQLLIQVYILQHELGKARSLHTSFLQQVKAQGSAISAEFQQLSTLIQQRSQTAQVDIETVEARWSKLPLIGRQSQLATLRHELEQVCDQGKPPRLTGITISGHDGMGKRRLADAVMKEAEWRQMSVIRGRFLPDQVATPYSGFQNAFSGPLSHAEVSQLQLLLTPQQIKHTAFLQTSLHARLPYESLSQSDSNQPSDGEVHSAIESIGRVWSSLVPTLLILENLQYADAQSLSLLQHLMKSLPDARLCILLTINQGAQLQDHRPLAAIAAILRHPSMLEVAASPLDADSQQTLLAHLLGQDRLEPALATKLLHSTAGVPQHIRETLRQLLKSRLIRRDAGGIWRLRKAFNDTALSKLRFPLAPALIEQTALRIQHLSGAERDVLYAASAMPEPIELGMLATLCGFDQATLILRLRPLLYREWLIADEQGLRFYSAVQRQAVYEQLSTQKSQSYHLNLAELYRRKDGKPSLRRVLQLYAAHNYDDALCELALLFEEEAAFGQLEKAISLCQYGIDIATQVQKRQHAKALSVVSGQRWLFRFYQERIAINDVLGRLNQVRDDNVQLQELAAGISDKRLQLQAQLIQAKLGGRVDGQSRDGLVIGLHVAAEALALGDQPLLADAQRSIAATYARLADFHNAGHYFTLSAEAFLSAASSAETSAKKQRFRVAAASARCNIAAVYWKRGEVDRSLKLAETLRCETAELNSARVRLDINHLLGILRSLKGDTAGSIDLFEEALAQSRELNMPDSVTMLMTNLGNAYLELPNFDKAIAVLEAGLDQAKRHSYTVGHVSFHIMLSDCFCRMGVLRVAEQHSKAALNIAETHQLTEWQLMALLVQMQIDLTGPTPERLKAVEQTIQIADTLMRETPLPTYHAQLENCRGRWHYHRRELAEARQIFQIATTKASNHEREWTHLNQLGEAMAALALGEPTPALALAQLVRSSESGMTARVGVLCRAVCFYAKSFLKDDSASDCLREASQTLYAHQSTISNPEWKQRYIDWIPLHNDLQNAIRRAGFATSSGIARIRAPRIDAPRGRSLHDDEYVDVVLEVEADEDAAIKGKVARRRHRLVRMLGEAQQQGAALTYQELADLLQVGVRTVERDMAALQKTLVELPSSRGNWVYHDG